MANNRPKSTQSRVKIVQKSSKIIENQVRMGPRDHLGTKVAPRAEVTPKALLRRSPCPPPLVGFQNRQKIDHQIQEVFSNTFLIDFGTILGQILSDFGSQDERPVCPFFGEAPAVTSNATSLLRAVWADLLSLAVSLAQPLSLI